MTPKQTTELRQLSLKYPGKWKRLFHGLTRGTNDATCWVAETRPKGLSHVVLPAVDPDYAEELVRLHNGNIKDAN